MVDFAAAIESQVAQRDARHAARGTRLGVVPARHGY